MPEAIIDLTNTLKSWGVLGHLITFAGSILTTGMFFIRYATHARAEIRKLRLETRNQYAEGLLKERLNCYGTCYSIISEFSKVSMGYRSGKMGYAGVSRAQLMAMSDALNNWDTQYAILLSTDSVTKIFELRGRVRKLIEGLTTEDSAEILSDADFWSLIDNIVRVEVALKTDIGVYAVDEFLSLSRPTSHPNVDQRTIAANAK